MTDQTATPGINPAAPSLVATSPPSSAATVKPNHLRKGGTLFAVAVVAVLLVVAWTMWRQIGAKKVEAITAPASAAPVSFNDGTELYRRQLDEERGQRKPADARGTAAPTTPTLPAAEQAAQQLLGQPMSVRAVRPLDAGQRAAPAPVVQPVMGSTRVSGEEVNLDAQIKALEQRLKPNTGGGER